MRITIDSYQQFIELLKKDQNCYINDNGSFISVFYHAELTVFRKRYKLSDNMESVFNTSFINSMDNCCLVYVLVSQKNEPSNKIHIIFVKSKLNKTYDFLLENYLT